MDRLAGRHFREPIKSDSPEIVRLHRQSKPRRRWAGCSSSPPCWLRSCCLAICETATCTALLVAVGMTLVGIVDDLVKLRTAAKGISVRHKLAAQLPWPALRRSCFTSSRQP